MARRKKKDDFLPDASDALAVGQGPLDVPYGGSTGDPMAAGDPMAGAMPSAPGPSMGVPQDPMAAGMPPQDPAAMGMPQMDQVPPTAMLDSLQPPSGGGLDMLTGGAAPDGTAGLTDQDLAALAQMGVPEDPNAMGAPVDAGAMGAAPVDPIEMLKRAAQRRLTGV